MSVIFTRACEYAVRGLVEMARHSEKESWTIPEIAEVSGTPAPFLAKTFQLLVKGGVLNSAGGDKVDLLLLARLTRFLLLRSLKLSTARR